MFTHFKLRSLQILRAIGYRLLSPTCAICRLPSQQARDLCLACEADLPLNHHACAQCALPITATSHNLCCGNCLQKPPAFHCTLAPYLYQKGVTRLIYDLKFNQQLANANIMGQLLAEKVREYYANRKMPQVIIPIPLHKKRLRHRGFNQAAEIGKPISRHLNIALDLFNCQRIIDTAPQSSLAATQRRKNLRGAFAIKPLHARHVAVLDDVITTGSTLREFCATLRKAGAEQIDVWCVARTNLG